MAQGPSFERVAADHWAYRAVRGLEQAGYATGSQEGTFGGTRKLTRYEFAMAVERMFRGLQPRVLSATDAGSLDQDLNRFRRLIREFAEDIAELGPDVAEMERQLATLEERVARLPRPEPARAKLFERPRTFGVRAALEPAAVVGTLSLDRPPVRPAPAGSGLSTMLGPATAEFRVDPGSRLDRATQVPLQDDSDLLGYQALLSVPFGGARFGAFYSRQGALADRYALDDPFLDLGLSESVGGVVTGSTGRLGLQLRAEKLSTLGDDLARRLGGALNYELGAGFSLGVGVERTWLGGRGSVADYSAYTAALARQFGKNTSFELRWRYYMPGRGFADGGVERDLGNSSAIGQISVRF
jgi:hypothetical protein